MELKTLVSHTDLKACRRKKACQIRVARPADRIYPNINHIARNVINFSQPSKPKRKHLTDV